MTRVAILGAGDMGTALLTPLLANGHDIRLWGTAFDEEIIAALRRGDPHPRIGLVAPRSVALFSHHEAEDALRAVDVAVVAVTSHAVRPVMADLGSLLDGARAIVSVGKGFDVAANDGSVLRLSQVIAGFTPAPVVAVGGPAIAKEVARGTPTAAVFGGHDPAALALSRETFDTRDYFVETITDTVGVEIAAAMKNAYGVAIGIADGLEKRTGLPHHNLRAALFPLAIAEMGRMVQALGGRAETVNGLAGCGDLMVTVTSGRNRLLGERVGAGLSGAAAFAELTAAGTTTEGYLAAASGYRLAARALGSSAAVAAQFPLLAALYRILYQDAPPREELWTAVRIDGGRSENQSGSQP
ncbi:MAG: NAD(P)-binding domain-containing protein [Thermomicrobiales bacterium]